MNIKRCIIGSIYISTLLSSVVYASPRFSRTEEEWARLEDNIFDYEEIKDLIHENNITVLKNEKSLSDFRKDYGNTRDEVSNHYREMADDLEEDMTGEDGMAIISDYNLQLQADNLRKKADDNLEDSYIYTKDYELAEAELVNTTKGEYIDYYITQISLDVAKKELESLKNNLDTTRVNYAAGTALYTDVLRLEEDIAKKEKEIREIEQSIENARQTVIVACGWRATDYPELTGLPDFNIDELISNINVDADTEEAILSNYTLLANQRKLENAEHEDNKDIYTKTVNDNKIRIRASLESSYRALMTYYRTYQQSIEDLNNLKRDLETAQVKLSVGSGTQKDMQAAQIASEKQEFTIKKNLLTCFKAYENYKANVAGIASAS